MIMYKYYIPPLLIITIVGACSRQVMIGDAITENGHLDGIGDDEIRFDNNEEMDGVTDIDIIEGDVDTESGVEPIIIERAETCDVDYLGNSCNASFGCCVSLWHGTELCINTDVSSTHCGGCGRLCPYPSYCLDGMCIAPSGYTYCGCAWADITSDPDHCGRCGNACPIGTNCTDGECETEESSCAEGYTLCGEGCRQLSTIQHCIECERKCRSVSNEDDLIISCMSTCGECKRSENTVGYDVIGWNSSAVTSICLIHEQIVWLGNQCLDDCPAGYIRIRDFIIASDFRDICVPYTQNESGPLFIFVDLYPRCGDGEYTCKGSGSQCIDGECTCMDGYTPCVLRESSTDYPGTMCTDLSVDEYSCGECWNRCADGLDCIEGECR